MRLAIRSLRLLGLAAGLLTAGDLTREFFAFDNGTGRDQKLPLDQQAELLRQAGYAGMGLFTGTSRIPEIVKALETRGLRLLAIYVHAFVDDSGPRIDPGLPEAVEVLRGRETMLMLTLRGKAPNDHNAVAVVREVADMARAAGLRVCLYPHLNFFIETASDGVRILRQARRGIVGVAFNMPHELNYQRRAGGESADWDRVLEPVREHVFLASIAGAAAGKGRETTVVRLDRSEHEILPFLAALDRAGYRGPVSLQAIGVKGDVLENLKAAMAEWRRLRAKL